MRSSDATRVSAAQEQRLEYHPLACQAWSIVWDDEEIFPEEIEAWKNGPVVRRLWDAHRGQYRVGQISGGNPDALTEAQRETVGLVLEFYGNKSAQWLSDLTHMEDPWKKAWDEGG